MAASNTLEFSRRLGFSLALALAPALIAPPAQASLMVTVTQGSAPVGYTEWAFSGSATYAEVSPGGQFALVPPPTAIVEWKGDALSDYVKTGTYNNFTPSIVSGSIGITVTPSSGPVKTGTIGMIHVDHDTSGPNSGDDFGVGLSSLLAIPINANDIVSWSGTGVFQVDINNLNIGSFPFRRYGETSSTPSQPFGNLPITITVHVPGPLPVLGCGVALSYSRQLRRKLQGSSQHTAK